MEIQEAGLVKDVEAIWKLVGRIIRGELEEKT